MSKTLEAVYKRKISQLVKERDAAEEVISEIYFRIIGKSPEWSNLFGHRQAVEEIVEAFDIVRAHAKSRITTYTVW